MTIWAKAVRLEGGVAPRFNDSAEDAAPPMDQVITLPTVTCNSILMAQVCDVACCR